VRKRGAPTALPPPLRIRLGAARACPGALHCPRPGAFVASGPFYEAEARPCRPPLRCPFCRRPAASDCSDMTGGTRVARPRQPRPRRLSRFPSACARPDPPAAPEPAPLRGAPRIAPDAPRFLRFVPPSRARPLGGRPPGWLAGWGPPRRAAARRCAGPSGCARRRGPRPLRPAPGRWPRPGASRRPPCPKGRRSCASPYPS